LGRKRYSKRNAGTRTKRPCVNMAETQKEGGAVTQSGAKKMEEEHERRGRHRGRKEESDRSPVNKRVVPGGLRGFKGEE